jgi:hypothetical protein
MSRVSLEDFPNARAVEHVRCLVGIRDDGKAGGELHRILLTRDGDLVLLDHTEEHLESWTLANEHGANLRCACVETLWMWKRLMRGASGEVGPGQVWTLPTWLKEKPSYNPKTGKWETSGPTLFYKKKDKNGDRTIDAFHKLSISWMKRFLPLNEGFQRGAALGMARYKLRQDPARRPEWNHRKRFPKGEEPESGGAYLQCAGRGEHTKFGDCAYRGLYLKRRKDEPTDSEIQSVEIQIENRANRLFKLRIIRSLDLRHPGVVESSAFQLKNPSERRRAEAWDFTNDQIKHVDRQQWLKTVVGHPWSSARSWGAHEFMIIDAPSWWIAGRDGKRFEGSDCFPARALVLFDSELSVPIKKRSFPVEWVWVWKSHTGRWGISLEHPRVYTSL